MKATLYSLPAIANIPLAGVLLVAVSLFPSRASHAQARDEKYDRKASQHWAELIRDPKPEVRQHAAFALRNLFLAESQHDPDSEHLVLRSLAQLVKDKDAGVRDAALTAFGDIEPETRYAYGYEPDLKLLEDKDWCVRDSAAVALGKLGYDARAAVPKLTKLLDDDHWCVRVGSESLGQYGDKRDRRYSEAH